MPFFVGPANGIVAAMAVYVLAYRAAGGERFAGSVAFRRPAGAQSAIIDGAARNADGADGACDAGDAGDAGAGDMYGSGADDACAMGDACGSDAGDACGSDAASGALAAREAIEANGAAHGAADDIREGRA